MTASENSTTPQPIGNVAGKPVYLIPRKSVINLHSGFAHKLLCDGPTFSAGDACVYSCSFCYVPGIFAKDPAVAAILKATGKQLEEIVIRRESAEEIVRRKLTHPNGKPKFTDPTDRRVIYASPLVDVAATLQLAEETVRICQTILELTHWQIRLLSKSSFLPVIARKLDAWRDRMIYGVSTGTLDNALARSFEEGTALVSKRIASLHQLQDAGYRTFGMICPSLPQDDYNAFSSAAMTAIRADRCEHVWAEVLNVRGESMVRTCSKLREGSFSHEADLLESVSTDGDAWEQYSRDTFLSHARFAPDGKLRFLQYVDRHNIAWWRPYATRGAVLLGNLAART